MLPNHSHEVREEACQLSQPFLNADPGFRNQAARNGHPLKVRESIECLLVEAIHGGGNDVLLPSQAWQRSSSYFKLFREAHCYLTQG